MKAKVFVAVVLGALLGSLVPAPAPAADAPTIYETLSRRDELAVLFVAVAEAKEAAALKSQEKQLTLFAPTDAAFRALGAAAFKNLVTDKNQVQKLFRAHLIESKLTTKELTDLAGKETPRTLQGVVLKVEKVPDGFRVGGAKIVSADVVCSNGVIHVIDAVLPLAKE
jgi:transforming growth factor-beta-induced protein